MDYALKRTAAGSFESVTEAVEVSLEAHGFVVVGMHDIHRAVARKGFDIRPVRIYELRDTTEALVPGRISVFEEGGNLVVAAVRPGVVDDLFPEAGLSQAAQEIEARLISVVEEATLT